MRIRARLSREWIILTVFTLLVWQLSYIPLGLLIGFRWDQWAVWFSVGSVYDVVVAWPVSKAVILFDRKARGGGWY